MGSIVTLASIVTVDRHPVRRWLSNIQAPGRAYIRRLTRIVREDSTATSVLWSAMVGTVITSCAVPFFWQPIQSGDIWAFLLIGALGTVAQALLIRAFALAEAAAIAPFGYTGLVWAGLWGWIFWGAIPDRWTIIGALIVVGAGIYVWMREARATHRTG